MVALPNNAHRVAERSCRTTARIVSWLTPKSTANERRLRVPARARIADSCSGVSLRARPRYREGVAASRDDGQRGEVEETHAEVQDRHPTVPTREVLKVRIRPPSLPPVHSFPSRLTPSGRGSAKKKGRRSGRGTTATAVLLLTTTLAKSCRASLFRSVGVATCQALATSAKNAASRSPASLSGSPSVGSAAVAILAPRSRTGRALGKRKIGSDHAHSAP